MTRIGPNQDINDPTTLEELRRYTEEAAVRANDHNNAYNSITENKSINPSIHPDNIRIIPISTLLSKIDGSKIEISGFTASGTYKQENIDLYTESVINTYINQPERFRNYYDNLISIINSWSDRDNSHPVTTTYTDTITTIADLINDHDGYARSLVGFQQKDGYVTVDKSAIPTSIDWSGSGPTNYNSGTYPQLTSAMNGIGVLMSQSIQPYLDISDILGRGYYYGADPTYGFFKNVILFERADWNSSSQKFAQTSNILAGQDSLDSPMPVSSAHFIRIPIMVSNFTNNSQNLVYTAKLTMIPRNTGNRIFQDFNPGFVNKRIWIVGLHTNKLEVNYISHNGSNTSEVNDMLTSNFDVQINDFILVPKRSLEIATVQIGFVNQLNIRNGSFVDWDTEDLLSDINVQFSVDGHSVDFDFDLGLERNMWNNPPSP